MDIDEMKLSPNVPGMHLVAASTVSLFFAYLCLRDGVALNRGFVIEREKAPLLYWLFILLYLFFTLGILWMGIDTMGSGRLAA